MIEQQIIVKNAFAIAPEWIDRDTEAQIGAEMASTCGKQTANPWARSMCGPKIHNYPEIIAIVRRGPCTARQVFLAMGSDDYSQARINGILSSLYVRGIVDKTYEKRTATWRMAAE